jgi:hypothetical protein
MENHPSRNQKWNSQTSALFSLVGPVSGCSQKYWQLRQAGALDLPIRFKPQTIGCESSVRPLCSNLHGGTVV